MGTSQVFIHSGEERKYSHMHAHTCTHMATHKHADTLEVRCASQNSHLLNQQSRLALMRNNEPSLNNNSLDGFHLQFRIYWNGMDTGYFSKL